MLANPPAGTPTSGPQLDIAQHRGVTLAQVLAGPDASLLVNEPDAVPDLAINEPDFPAAVPTTEASAVNEPKASIRDRPTPTTPTAAAAAAVPEQQSTVEIAAALADIPRASLDTTLSVAVRNSELSHVKPGLYRYGRGMAATAVAPARPHLHRQRKQAAPEVELLAELPTGLLVRFSGNLYLAQPADVVAPLNAKEPGTSRGRAGLRTPQLRRPR